MFSRLLFTSSTVGSNWYTIKLAVSHLMGTVLVRACDIVVRAELEGEIKSGCQPFGDLSALECVERRIVILASDRNDANVEIFHTAVHSEVVRAILVVEIHDVLVRPSGEMLFARRKVN